MERDDALRVWDQVIAAGYGCDIRATNVTEASGAQYTVAINIAGSNDQSKLRTLQDIADSNGADTNFVVNSAPQVYAWLVIASPKWRPEHGHPAPGTEETP